MMVRSQGAQGPLHDFIPAGSVNWLLLEHRSPTYLFPIEEGTPISIDYAENLQSGEASGCLKRAVIHTLSTREAGVDVRDVTRIELSPSGGPWSLNWDGWRHGNAEQLLGGSGSTRPLVEPRSRPDSLQGQLKGLWEATGLGEWRRQGKD